MAFLLRPYSGSVDFPGTRTGSHGSKDQSCLTCSSDANSQHTPGEAILLRVALEGLGAGRKTLAPRPFKPLRDSSHLTTHKQQLKAYSCYEEFLGGLSTATLRDPEELLRLGIGKGALRETIACCTCSTQNNFAPVHAEPMLVSKMALTSRVSGMWHGYLKRDCRIGLRVPLFQLQLGSLFWGLLLLGSPSSEVQLS